MNFLAILPATDGTPPLVIWDDFASPEAFVAATHLPEGTEIWRPDPGQILPPLRAPDGQPVISGKLLGTLTRS